MFRYSIQSIFRKFFPKVKKEKFLSKNYITKQKFQAFLRCEMSSWISTRENKIGQIKSKKFHTSANEYKKIRNLLRVLYKRGKEVRYANSVEDSIFATFKYIKKRVPVFSASLGRGEVYSNFDLLVPEKKNSWSIITVKSQAAYKKDNVSELAYQKYVAEKSGLNIAEIILYSVNPDYLYLKKIDPEKYFIKNNLTEKVNKELPNIRVTIDKYFRNIQSTSPPENPNLCRFPADCLNKNICYPALKDGNIFELREGKEISQKLYKSGIIYLKDIPQETELLYKQAIQVECEKTASPHVATGEIESFLKKVSYPLYFLDFETINPALPFFKNTKPFQHIPIQYSLHVKKSPNSQLEHFSFLAKGKSDPRKNILKNLSRLISLSGKVVVYDAFFERRVFVESVSLFPEFREWWSDVSQNILDISIPFKSFHYYHPLQKGRASLKAVLPALTGHNYDGL